MMFGQLSRFSAWNSRPQRFTAASRSDSTVIVIFFAAISCPSYRTSYVVAKAPLPISRSQAMQFDGITQLAGAMSS